MDVKDEIMRRVEALSPEEQRKLLAQLNHGAEFPIKGESPESLLAFAGTLDDQSAAEMIAAIEAEFETVDDGER
jgi:hypothetical protein